MVDRALEADRLLKYHRAAAGSTFDAFAAQVLVLLAQAATMPASVLAERVGWSGSGSGSVFRDKVAAIRPEHEPQDPADRLCAISRVRSLRERSLVTRLRTE